MIAELAFALMTGAVQVQEEPLELTLFRTRAANGVTAVDAIAEIHPDGLFEQNRCTYVVEVVVRDSVDSEVVRDRWNRSADCEVFRADPAARVVDTFSFAVRPGRYTVEMAVTPGGGGAVRTVRSSLETLERGAPASDLYLAREVGWTDSTQAGGWAVRKGQLGIAAEAVLQIPASRPLLGYYLELYQPGQPRVNGVVRARIRRPQGASVAEFMLQRIESLDSDRPVAGTVSLAGLPPGRYDLEVTVGFDGVPDLVRSQVFELTRQVVPEAAQQAASGAESELREYFQRLPVEELARFDAIVLWMTSDDARRQYGQLSADGKRQYLAEFFQRASFPVEGSETVTGTDALRLFLERTREVERNFAERTGDSARPTWQTDRGRIVMLRGMPADRIRRPMPANDTRPYEIWYYNIGSGYVYLFTDESGFGHYRMIYTTDPTMVTLPDWARRVGPGAVTELRTYYGIRDNF